MKLDEADHEMIRRLLVSAPEIEDEPETGERVAPVVVVMRPLKAKNPHKEFTPCPFLAHVWSITSESTLRDLTLYCAKCGWAYPEIVRDEEGKTPCFADGCKNERKDGTQFCGQHI